MRTSTARTGRTGRTARTGWLVSPAHLAHLARRWRSTVRRRQPLASDLAWVRTRLSEPELALWQQLTPTDQTHTIEVARLVGRNGEPGNLACAAALLHDIGKIETSSSATVRVGAALLQPFVSVTTARRWAQAGGWRAGLGRLLDYPSRGAALLAAADSDPVVVAWAAEHHLSPEHWSVQRSLGMALQRSDDQAL